MNLAKCFTAGLKRVFQTPSLVCWIYLTLVVLVFPLTAVMRNVLRESIGGSLVHQNLRQGFDLDWYGEFAAGHSGMARTFGPGVVGILPMLGNLERLADGMILQTDGTVLSAGALFLLVWAFFAGGIIHRYAKPDESFTRSVFFAESARYFFRFLRLLVLSVAVYLAVARWVTGKLFPWMDRATRDVTAERTVILYTALIYAAIVLILAVVSMAVDYAKIALVTEDRRSAILALLRGLAFVFSNPIKTLGLYLALLLVGSLWLLIYGFIAPGPNQSTTFAVLLTFAVSQVFLIGRLILKLWFLSGQTLLFQSAVGTTKERLPA